MTTIFDQSLTRWHGGRVELRGFGAFSVKHRGTRIGRNPRTGEEVPVELRLRRSDDVAPAGLA